MEGGGHARCEREKGKARKGGGGVYIYRERESQTLLKCGRHGNTARLPVGLAGAAATLSLSTAPQSTTCTSLHGATRARRATGG